MYSCMCTCAFLCCGLQWRSEDKVCKLFLSFCHVGAGNHAQVIRFGGNCFGPLSHLSDPPQYFLSKWMNKNNLSINQCRIKSLWGPGVLCEWTSTHFILLSKVGPGCNAPSTNTQHVLPYPWERLNGREAHSVEGEWTGIVSSSRTGCAHGSDWWRGLKLGQAATDSPNSISQEPRFQVMILCETFHIQAIAHF